MITTVIFMYAQNNTNFHSIVFFSVSIFRYEFRGKIKAHFVSKPTNIHRGRLNIVERKMNHERSFKIITTVVGDQQEKKTRSKPI